MIAINKAEWVVRIIEAKNGHWWSANTRSSLGLYTKELTSPIIPGCTLEEAQAAWEDFAILNNIEKWRFE